VLLIPVVLLVARRGNHSLMRIGIPALAGLSVMHGLVPGPLAAIDSFRIFDVIGSPLIALLSAVVLAMFTLGRAAGFSKGRISSTVEKSLGPIAGILLIVGAGGGFKQTLIDAGIGQMILNWRPIALTCG
jgi:H+/gluconate symporter-like permease